MRTMETRQKYKTRKSEIKNAALQLRRVGESEDAVNGLKMHKYAIKYRQAITSYNKPVCEQG